MFAVDLTDVEVAFMTELGISLALCQINLHIPAGKWCSVIGENGSGKSTLAKIIANQCPISNGKILIMGEERETNPQSRVQMVFQNPDSQIIGDTVFEDIAFGLSIQNVPTEHMRDEVLAILNQFSLADWIDKPVSELSGGQKQLLCVVSSIALKPDIIVFDECTSMLDEGSRQIVLHAAKMLVQSGKTVIWITHHLEELSYADEIIVMEKGQVQYQGTPRAFLYETPMGAGSKSWCRTLGFTPPYVVQIAEQLRAKHGLMNFMPLNVTELFQGEQIKQCPSN